MYSPTLRKDIDFNDPAKRAAFEASYRGTVGPNARSPLDFDSEGNPFFNGITDQANRNAFDAQNDPEAPYRAMAKKAELAKRAYKETSADIEDLRGSAYDNIMKMFRESMDKIGRV